MKELSETQKYFNQIYNDPSTSNWLRQALASSLKRDPVDAIKDAEFLYHCLNDSFMRIMEKHMAEEKKRKAEKKALRNKIKSSIVVKPINRTLQ